MLCGCDFEVKLDGQADLPTRSARTEPRRPGPKPTRCAAGFGPHERRRSARQGSSGASWNQPGPVWPLPPLVGNPPQHHNSTRPADSSTSANWPPKPTWSRSPLRHTTNASLAGSRPAQFRISPTGRSASWSSPCGSLHGNLCLDRAVGWPTCAQQVARSCATEGYGQFVQRHLARR